MLSNSIDFTRNWSSALNRLAYGILTLKFIAVGNYIPGLNNYEQGLAQALSVETIPTLIVILVTSMLLGACCVTIGTILQSAKYREDAQTVRAYNVSKLDNQLLTRRYIDSQAKFDLAAGWFGFTAIVILIGLFFWIAEGNSGPSFATGAGADWSWPVSVLIFFVSVIISGNSRQSIDAIDEVIAQNNSGKDASSKISATEDNSIIDRHTESEQKPT